MSRKYRKLIQQNCKYFLLAASISQEEIRDFQTVFFDDVFSEVN